MHADAITGNPHFGSRYLLPFLEKEEKGIFIHCLTSGEARKFQHLNTTVGKTECAAVEKFLGREIEHGVPFYEYVAFKVSHSWNKNNNCGLVVEATQIDELRAIRSAVGDRISILSPDIGAQGGDTCEAFNVGKNSDGEGLILNPSCNVICFAVPGEDLATTARRETQKLVEEIHRARLTDGCRLYDGQASLL